MKKFVFVILAIFMVLSASACGYGDTELTYDKKYYCSDDYQETISEEDRKYYIFYKDGTGIYHYTDGVYSNYTIKFKYTIIKGESTLIAIADEINEDVYNSMSTLTWTATLIYSDFAVINTAGMRFLTEDYVKAQSPNFGSKV